MIQMISCYRLGDLVSNLLNKEEINDILTHHPNSIGSQYILERNKNKTDSNIRIATKIVIEHCKQNIHHLPKDIEDSTVIHLRLGDVVSGNKWHELQKRPLSIEQLKTIIPNDTTKKYIIGKCFFAKTSSTNFKQCIEISNIYLNNVMTELQAEHFDSGDPDIDLCFAIKSKIFIQGKGYFSELMKNIRKELKLENIELLV